MTQLTYPRAVEIEPGVFIEARDEGLFRVDMNAGAVCPCETAFPGEASRLAYMALLSPQLMGAQATTSPARRAAWVYRTKYALRFMLKYVRPFIEARRRTFRRAPPTRSPRHRERQSSNGMP
jgi:hypothetical protein